MNTDKGPKTSGSNEPSQDKETFADRLQHWVEFREWLHSRIPVYFETHVADGLGDDDRDSFKQLGYVSDFRFLPDDKIVRIWWEAKLDSEIVASGRVNIDLEEFLEWASHHWSLDQFNKKLSDGDMT